MPSALPKPTEYQPGPSVSGARPCQDRLDMILPIIGDCQDKSVLDIGCSTGWFCRELAKRGAKVLGVEQDHGTTEKAKQYAVQEKLYIKFICGDYCDDEIYRDVILNGGFDFVLYLSVLHYYKLRERKAALAAVAFFAKQGMFFEYADHHANGDMAWGNLVATCLGVGFSAPEILGKAKGGRLIAYFPKAEKRI